MGGWTIAAVLSRTSRRLGNLETLTDADAFFAQETDLMIDLAGPDVLGTYGKRMLAQADCWTVNAAPLADDALVRRLEQAGQQHGHRLRVLTGAMAGLDGVAAATVDDHAEVNVSIDLAPSHDPGECVFSGTAAAAAEQYPEHVNVGVAAALAGKGVNETRVEVHRPNVADGRKLRLRASGAHGTFESLSAPRVKPGEIHTVASCVIAALRQQDSTIWVG